MIEDRFTVYHVEATVTGGASDNWIPTPASPRSPLGEAAFQCHMQTGVSGFFDKADAEKLIEQGRASDHGVMTYRIIRSKYVVQREVVS